MFALWQRWLHQSEGIARQLTKGDSAWGISAFSAPLRTQTPPHEKAMHILVPFDGRAGGVLWAAFGSAFFA